MKKIGIYIGSVISLIVIGFLLYRYFIEISFSQLDDEIVGIYASSVGGRFSANSLFALSIGSIPLLHLIVSRLAKLKSFTQSLTTIGIMMICGVLFWQVRIFYLNNLIKYLSGFKLEEGIEMSIDFRDLYLGGYLFVGFLIGGIISTLLFVFKNKKQAL